MEPRSFSDGYGKLFALGEDTPFRHAEIWAREATTGRDRLRIGGGQNPVKLLVTLADALAEPLYVLAVIRVPFAGGAAKYESGAMTHADVASFFDDFGKLFSDDGRAEAWVGSIEDEGLIVLDDNDLLYAHGPLDEFERILRDRGFRSRVPFAAKPPRAQLQRGAQSRGGSVARVVRLGQRASAGRRRVGKQRLLKEQAFYR